MGNFATEDNDKADLSKLDFLKTVAIIWSSIWQESVFSLEKNADLIWRDYDVFYQHLSEFEVDRHIEE